LVKKKPEKREQRKEFKNIWEGKHTKGGFRPGGSIQIEKKLLKEAGRKKHQEKPRKTGRLPRRVGESKKRDQGGRGGGGLWGRESHNKKE